MNVLKEPMIVSQMHHALTQKVFTNVPVTRVTVEMVLLNVILHVRYSLYNAV